MNDWTEWSPSKQITCLKQVIKEIRISRSRVDITFTRTGLAATLMETLVDIDIPADSENDAYRLSVPVRLKQPPAETPAGDQTGWRWRQSAANPSQPDSQITGNIQGNLSSYPRFYER